MNNETKNVSERFSEADKKKILDALKLIRQECANAKDCKECPFCVPRGCRFKLEGTPESWELIDDESQWCAFRESTRRSGIAKATT